MTVTPGTVLANKYRVERLLGRGGMGLVVEATNLKMDRRVALKFLHAEAMGNPIAVERFQREARAAGRIDHPHVARVFDVEELETGAPYMVMEYLEGIDLEVWLRQNGKLPVEQVATFMLQVCDAIAEAHRLGIVHRDIKPANLFVTHTATGLPFIKVLDFGISKVVKDPIGSVTKTTSFLGSPLYMSPEQMKSSKDVDARSDIWSLGAVLFELLTGEVPFRAETIPELTLKVTLAPTPSVTLARPDVSALLESVVHRCLEKDRELRYGSAKELADALEPFAAPSKSSERPSADVHEAAVGGQVRSEAQTRTADLPDGPYSVRGKPIGTESSWSRSDAAAAPKSPRRWPLLLAGLCVPVLGLVWLTDSKDEPAPESIEPHVANTVVQPKVEERQRGEQTGVGTPAADPPNTQLRQDEMNTEAPILPPQPSAVSASPIGKLGYTNQATPQATPQPSALKPSVSLTPPSKPQLEPVGKAAGTQEDGVAEPNKADPLDGMSLKQ